MIRKVLFAALMASALAAPATAAPTLKMVSLDMEGGAATLFVTPEGKSLLIDTGWANGVFLKPSPDGAQNSADRIVAAAKKLGVSKIDYLIITHYHADHLGGIFDLVARMPVDTFIDHGPVAEMPPPGLPPERLARTTKAQYEKYVAELLPGHKHIVAKPGDVIHIGSLTDTVVASNGVPIATPMPGAGQPNPVCNDPAALVTKNVGGEENARSVASLLRFGKVTIAAFGDLSWLKEHELSCPVTRIGHVNLLIVTQHGSDISSNPASLADMRPDVAIMSNGARKGGDADPIRLVSSSPGLMGFWKNHELLAHPELSGDKNYIANLDPPGAEEAFKADPKYMPAPDMGYAIQADIAKDGTITVTNDRNGFSKTYHVE